MKKRLLAIILSLCLCMGMMSAGINAVSAAVTKSDREVGFDPNNYKGKITKISVKEPYTKDGITYLPMEVNFHVNEDISDSNSVYFMEGYNNIYLADGRKAESLPGVGMTLMGPMKPDVPLEWNNQFIWKWNGWENGGDGTVRYDVTMAAENDPQEITQSPATGLTEVSGVKPNDQVGFRLETVMNTENIPEAALPPGGVVVSDEAKITIEDKSKYPKEINLVADDKTIAPPEEVVLTYNGQAQNCPYTNTAGYTVLYGDPETDKGIYTAILNLNSGYKWTDGTTEMKPAVWAINPATITSVTLSASQLTYNGNDQTPRITSVKAGDLTVPEGGYTATFPEPSKFSGNYTVTVKGKGNFTGSASANYSIVAIYADTCNHSDYEKEYVDNKDNATHKTFCTHCGGCLANAEKHDLKNEPKNDPETGKPAGKYRIVCTKCGYAVDGDCDHSVPHEYVDKGNGTHDERCSRCHVVFKTGEAHDIKVTPVLSNVGGYEIYNGEVSIDCTKCGYHEDQICSHVGTGRVDYTPKGSYPNYTHRSRCERCSMMLFDQEEACTPGEWAPRSLSAHETHCTKCGQLMTGTCDFKGTRKITKFEATPYKGGLFNMFTRYNYRCWYTETCKICHGVRSGWFDYPIIDVERWADYRAAFESIVKMNPEELQSFSDQDYLEGYKYYLMIPSWYLSPLYEATGTNEMNFANLQSGWLTKLTNTDEAGSCKMFDKNGKEIKSYKPDGGKKSSSPVGADGDENEGEGISEDELETWSITEEDGAAVALSTDYLMSLADGEYTYTACFSNENGQTAAVSVVFTIAHDENGTKVKNVHPLGTMVNADGDVVGMNLSKDTLYYTGELLTLPAVTLTSEMGVEYAEGEDYTLTYYQVVEDEDGEAVEVEIAPENIKDVGIYNVVATPTRNGVLSGEAWAQFIVVEAPLITVGDLNNDGVSDVLDAVMIQKYTVDKIELNKQQIIAADVNNDNIVDILDAVTIQKFAVDKISEHPKKA